MTGGFTNNLYGSVKSQPELMVGINVITGLPFSELAGVFCVVQHMLKASPVIFTALLHKWAVRCLLRPGESSG